MICFVGHKRLASVQSAGHLLTKQLALRPFGSAFELRVRQGRAPGPWPPAAALGDVQLSQTLTRLSAREREVSPTPVIPTRRWALAEPPCTPWQLIPLGPKRGLPLSGHSKAGITRRLSLHPVRRLRRQTRGHYHTSRARHHCNPNPTRRRAKDSFEQPEG
jgi:hypothetical protein